MRVVRRRLGDDVGLDMYISGMRWGMMEDICWEESNNAARYSEVSYTWGKTLRSEFR